MHHSESSIKISTIRFWPLNGSTLFKNVVIRCTHFNFIKIEISNTTAYWLCMRDFDIFGHKIWLLSGQGWHLIFDRLKWMRLSPIPMNFHNLARIANSVVFFLISTNIEMEYEIMV